MAIRMKKKANELPEALNLIIPTTLNTNPPKKTITIIHPKTKLRKDFPLQIRIKWIIAIINKAASSININGLISLIIWKIKSAITTKIINIDKHITIFGFSKKLGFSGTTCCWELKIIPLL